MQRPINSQELRNLERIAEASEKSYRLKVKVIAFIACFFGLVFLFVIGSVLLIFGLGAVATNSIMETASDSIERLNSTPPASKPAEAFPALRDSYALPFPQQVPPVQTEPRASELVPKPETKRNTGPPEVSRYFRPMEPDERATTPPSELDKEAARRALQQAISY